jgi:hypothetical protein
MGSSRSWKGTSLFYFLECQINEDLNLLRKGLAETVAREAPAVIETLRYSDSVDQLRVTNEKDTVRAMAKYSYQVLSLIDEYPLYFATSHTHVNAHGAGN